MVFLDPDEATAARQVELLEEVVESEGQSVLGWRDVPHDPEAIGWLARESMPCHPADLHRSAGDPGGRSGCLRAQALRDPPPGEKRIGDEPGDAFFYVPSLSSRTIVYTGC